LSKAFDLGMGNARLPMMSSRNDAVAHHQNGPDRGIGTRATEATSRLLQRGSHKELVTVFRGHATGISATEAQRNRAV
jgi:hypothetical protein